MDMKKKRKISLGIIPPLGEVHFGKIRRCSCRGATGVRYIAQGQVETQPASKNMLKLNLATVSKMKYRRK